MEQTYNVLRSMNGNLPENNLRLIASVIYENFGDDFVNANLAGRTEILSKAVPLIQNVRL